MKSGRCQLFAILVLLLACHCLAAEMVEDVVQEIEELIQQSYSGRARSMALKRLDTLINQDMAEDERLAQMKAYRSHLIKSGARRELGKPPATADVASNPDSDADGVPDKTDPHPLLADYNGIHWELLSFELMLAGAEKKSRFRFNSAQVKDGENEATHPLTLLGAGLMEAEAKTKLRLAPGRQLNWDEDNRHTAIKCRNWTMATVEEQQKLDAFVTLDVAFHNAVRDRDLTIQNAQVELRYGTEDALTGRCVELAENIELSATPARSTVLRFIARVDQAQLLKFVLALQQQSPVLDCAAAGMQIVDEEGRNLLAVVPEIEKRTRRIALRASDGEIGWAAATRRGGVAVTLGEALSAIDDVAKNAGAPTVFASDGEGVPQIAGVRDSALSRWILVDSDRRILKLADATTEPLTDDLTFDLLVRDAVQSDLAGWQQAKNGAGDTQDYIQRIRMRAGDWELAISLGWPEAMFLLGQLAELEGGEQSLEKAILLYKAAAKAELPAAMNRLGEMAGLGLGMEMDDRAAAQWFVRAVELGDVAAMDNLARRFYYGLGAEQNLTEAVELFMRAAEAGNIYAMNSLGWFSVQGVHEDLTPDVGVGWYRKAAEAGYPPAMTGLANFYRGGVGLERDLAEALKWYRLAAEAGEPEALLQLGKMYEAGEGLDPDYRSAFNYYRKAALAGNHEAETHLGRMYETGRGAELSYASAVEWYTRAANAGDLEGIYNLGRVYADGIGFAPDLQKAVSLYRRAAEEGLAAAQIELGLMYEYGRGVERDDAKARQWIQAAADQQVPEALAHLGWLYENGRGVEQSYEKAVTLYRQAARLGNPLGQTYLGVSYQFGHAVERDLAKALQWYSKAAEQGFPQATYSLALMYWDGSGVARDPEKAVELLTRAAQAGDSRAQASIGMLYQKGEGVTRDLQLALAWYRKAAAQDDPDALFALGRIHETGEGVETNLQAALDFYRKAFKNGSIEAGKALKRLGHPQEAR